jgi:adenine phosphoribosyltransferase
MRPDELPVEDLFVNVPDFPIPGFNFPDITYLLERSPATFRAIVDRFSERFRAAKVEHVMCIESFGHIFGAPVAYNLNCPLLLARRPEKLPRGIEVASYAMCYCQGKRLAIHQDAVSPGGRVLIVDDFLASGGTLKAALQLLESVSAQVVGAAFVSELVDFGARRQSLIANIDVFSILKMAFDPRAGRWRVLANDMPDRSS